MNNYKDPYVVSVYIENLKWEIRHKKEYVKLTKVPIQTLYHELVFYKFYEEYPRDKADEIYRKWLTKYNFKDDLIFKKELEPKYREYILSKYKNREKLFKNRVKYERERYYNLPEPLNRVDWRTLFDNIFIWQDGNKKYARRGGSGSSGAREIDSKFTYAFLELSKSQKIPSYFFIYTSTNELLLVNKFESLTIPAYELGSNYSINRKVHEDLVKNGNFIKIEDFFDSSKIKVTIDNIY